MPIDTVEILRELVSIPSINPMGRGDLAPVGEARLTEHLAARLTALGLFVERQTVAPGRENILARLDGDPPPERGGGLLLFDAHQDTVPADNMTIEPWCATLREGRLYGRGACDVKGGMAAMIATLARLAAERPAGMPTILLSCPVDEEYQFSGVRALTAAWCDGKARTAARRGHRGRADRPGRRRGAQGRDPLVLPHPRPRGPQLAACPGRQRDLQDGPSRNGHRALLEGDLRRAARSCASAGHTRSTWARSRGAPA